MGNPCPFPSTPLRPSHCASIRICVCAANIASTQPVRWLRASPLPQESVVCMNGEVAAKSRQEIPFPDGSIR